jgi:hypothetical protein
MESMSCKARGRDVIRIGTANSALSLCAPYLSFVSASGSRLSVYQAIVEIVDFSLQASRWLEYFVFPASFLPE